jgi:uncharacterized protein (TIGR02466 family)
MFSSVEVTQLFPTCVWQHEVTAAAEINPPMLAEVQRLMANEPSRARVKGTWQSGGELYSNPAFEPVVRAAAEAAKGVVRFLAWNCEGLQITDMWANVNQQGHGARPHTHPNNFLAGVYYLQVRRRPANWCSTTRGRRRRCWRRPRASAVSTTCRARASSRRPAGW